MEISSLLSLLFSRLNKLNSLSFSSYVRLSNPLNVFVALLWTLEGTFFLLVHCFMSVVSNLWNYCQTFRIWYSFVVSFLLSYINNNLFFCFPPIVLLYIVLLIPLQYLANQLLLVAATYSCLSPLISLMLSKYGRHWVSCRLTAQVMQMLQRCSPLLASRMNLSVTV